MVILADDLSGAADCAAGYAQKGLTTTVELTKQGSGTIQPDVAVFDTDSRHLSPTEAADINQCVWRAVRSGDIRLYKKIDSTLRGNWAQEVAALIPEVGMALVAPAMPAMKRFTQGAHQYIGDTPVEQTPVWQNEGRQGTAAIDIMLINAGASVAHLSLSTLRQSTIEALGQELVTYRQQSIGAVICDAESESDLERLALASHQLEDIFWVGSAGLSNAICPYFQNDLHKGSSPVLTVEGPVLTVVCSMSSISHRQVDYLLAQSEGRIEHYSINIHELLLSTKPPAALARAQQALEKGKDVLVSLAQQEPDAAIDSHLLPQRLAHHFSGYFKLLGALVATGGETARALLVAAGIERLHLMNELEPGVALSVSDQGMPVVTKAGAFGCEQTLYAVWSALVVHRASRLCVGELS
ncbi:four-carbon acid sugar kinase family protein [Halomonas sp. NyZ770]|uniref:four-carbon acid sugar kinase family protein n=1 Tax=Halomonas sp. NyZ770 TaxID=2883106 RepID=UPI001D0A3240|nr:four-carbon acid sugar kinase family protein [Halomonas sp. NyZ770]UDM08594.1 four-carbon acid sugar kinase family protein [Halomonas sp. NyZ770]